MLDVWNMHFSALVEGKNVNLQHTLIVDAKRTMVSCICSLQTIH